MMTIYLKVLRKGTVFINRSILLTMRKPSVDIALKILAEIPIEQAFYFNNDVGSPSGEFAKSLNEFINKIKVIEIGSLEFHMYRGDFEKWIMMLGDETLSQQIANLKLIKLKDETLRNRLLKILRLRHGSLRKIVKNEKN